MSEGARVLDVRGLTIAWGLRSMVALNVDRASS